MQPRYFGDCRENLSPTSLKQNWDVAKQYVAKQKSKIKVLQQQNRRMKAKIYCQQTLLNYLKEHYQITDTAESTLKVSMKLSHDFSTSH